MNISHKPAKQKRVISDETRRYELTSRLEQFEFIFNTIPEALIFTDPIMFKEFGDGRYTRVDC